MFQDVIQKIRTEAKKNPKKILFPESEDPRICEAVERINAEGIAEAVLITPDRIDSSHKDIFAYMLYEFRKNKGMTREKAGELLEQRLFAAAMMVRCGLADGFVAGAAHSTADVMRAVIHCFEINDRIGMISSCFIMGVPDCRYGEDGIILYSDCGVIPDPTSEQLARIAVASAQFFQETFQKEARVALLSFSSKGSAQGAMVTKVRDAVEMAKDLKKDFFIDGELQADSALVPEVAALKLKGSDVAGRANILIFPNLDAGNICYKITERLAHARAIGPIILGAVQPCSDLSRGCSVEDIIDCAAMTVVRAQQKEKQPFNTQINFDKYYANIGL